MTLTTTDRLTDRIHTLARYAEDYGGTVAACRILEEELGRCVDITAFASLGEALDNAANGEDGTDIAFWSRLADELTVTILRGGVR